MDLGYGIHHLSKLPTCTETLLFDPEKSAELQKTGHTLFTVSHQDQNHVKDSRGDRLREH